MLDDKTLKRLTKPLKETPNILALDLQPARTGSKRLAIATAEVRSIAQNLIDTVDGHAHLKTHDAVILMLIERSEATANKLDAGERVSIGKASRASGEMRLLAAVGGGDGTEPDRPNFRISLSGDWIDRLSADPDRERKITALIDHELSHCSAKVAGSFVSRAELGTFLINLSAHRTHIETCDAVQDDVGKILVRYWATDPQGRLMWKMKKHEVEEFHGVIRRHGAWDGGLSTLVDVLVEHEGPGLFEAAGRRGDSAAAG